MPQGQLRVHTTAIPVSDTLSVQVPLVEEFGPDALCRTFNDSHLLRYLTDEQPVIPGHADPYVCMIVQVSCPGVDGGSGYILDRLPWTALGASIPGWRPSWGGMLCSPWMSMRGTAEEPS